MNNNEPARTGFARTHSLLFSVTGFMLICLHEGYAHAVERAALTVGFIELGAVKVGMTPDEAMRVNRGLEFMPRRMEAEGEHCYYLEDPGRLPDSQIMVIDGRIATFNIGDSKVKTASGIGVGDKIAKDQSTYGNRIQIKPDPVSKELMRLYLRSNDGRYALRFLTIDGKVQSIVAGSINAVYREGRCDWTTELPR